MIKEKVKKMFQNSFAKSIIELKLVSDRIIAGKGSGSGIFTVKYQMLYLIANNEKISPTELIHELNMAKSNLAILAKKLIDEGLILRVKEAGNNKQIYYIITEKGLNDLSIKMESIDNLCSEESKEMIKHLDKTVQTLKKVK